MRTTAMRAGDKPSSRARRPRTAAPCTLTPMAVVLERGRGQKRQLNGKRAHVTRGLAGGWTVVSLEDGGSVKWRTGHWQEEGAEPPAAKKTASEPAAALILSLADDQLMDIARQLDTPSVCSYLCVSQRFAALEAGSCFGECHLRDGLPSGYGVATCKQLAFARFLAAKHAKLHSLHVDMGRDDVTVLRLLLQECDTRELTTAQIRVEGARYGQMTRCSGVVIDWSTVHLDQSNPADTLLAEVGSEVKVDTKATITGVLAQFCPALRTLSLIYQGGDAEDVPSLGAIKSLHRLEVNLGEVCRPTSPQTLTPQC